MALFDRLREIASHTLIYGVGSAATSAVSLILLPVYTRNLTPDRFGILALLIWLGSLAGAFFYLGASTALSRWYFEYGEGDERGRLINTALFLTGVGALSQFLIGIIGGGWLSQLIFGDQSHHRELAVAFTSSAVTLVNSILLVVLRFERRSLLVVGTGVGGALATVALVWLLVGPYQVIGVLVGLLCPQIVTTLVLGFVCRRYLTRGLLRPAVARMLIFGLTSSMIGLAFYVLDWLDRLVLERLCTLNEVGVYSLGARLATIIQIVFVMAFAQIWQPMRMQYRAEAQSAGLFRVILSYYTLAGSILVVALSIFAGEILHLLGGHAGYREAVGVVPWLMGGVLFYGMLNILDLGLWLRQRIHWHVIVFLAAIAVNLGLCFVLIPILGINGAACAKLVTFALVAVATAILSHRLLPISYEWGRVVSTVVLSALFIAVISVIPVVGLMAIVVKTSGVLVYIYVCWLLLSSVERLACKKFIRRRLYALS